MQTAVRAFSAGLIALVIAVAVAPAPAPAPAHPSEDEIIRQLEEQYGRPRPSQDPDRGHNARGAEDPPPPSMGQAVWQYLVIGYFHILPKGLDHILFVCGLFLASIQFRPLLIQVTSFTVAHTCTLALAILGYVNVPGAIVEPLIALSIAGVAIENIAFNRMTPWRPAVVFGFGLLHGLGFAGVLADIGMPEGQFITGLVSFNVGVEIGQLTVLAGLWAMLHWFYKRPWYRASLQIPVSAVIAAIGLYWAIERVFF